MLHVEALHGYSYSSQQSHATIHPSHHPLPKHMPTATKQGSQRQQVQELVSDILESAELKLRNSSL